MSFLQRLFGASDAADTATTDEPHDEWRDRPNRADIRAQRGGRRPVTRHRAIPHPLAMSDGLTDLQRAEETAAAARLDAAHARNEARPEDERAPWIAPAVEQGYRDRKASRKAQRRARRTTRSAR